jgi:hypothetical protein
MMNLHDKIESQGERSVKELSDLIYRGDEGDQISLQLLFADPSTLTLIFGMQDLVVDKQRPTQTR